MTHKLRTKFRSFFNTIHYEVFKLNIASRAVLCSLELSMDFGHAWAGLFSLERKFSDLKVLSDSTGCFEPRISTFNLNALSHILANLNPNRLNCWILFATLSLWWYSRGVLVFNGENWTVDRSWFLFLFLFLNKKIQKSNIPGKSIIFKRYSQNWSKWSAI